MNKKFLILVITVFIVTISFFVSNPFLANCNIFGCIYGNGWPLPFYYAQYCKMGDIGCQNDYIYILHLLIDIMIIVIILFTIFIIIQKFSKNK